MRLARARLATGLSDVVSTGDGHWIRVDRLGLPHSGEPRDFLRRAGEAAQALSPASVQRLLEAGDAAPDGDGMRFASPLGSVGKILAIGMNYRDHIAEVGAEPPPNPLLFGKFPSAITGPREPVAIDESIVGQADYEVELGVVIGRAGRDIPERRALEHVLGYLVANDISSRDIQFSEPQWIRSKSFDGFCPIGPWLTSVDAIPDPQALELSSTVNGEPRQRSTTAEMLFSVAEIIAFCSRGTTLAPGDLILTGTPPGVAMGLPGTPWLRPGDVVECAVEGLGALRNAIIAHDRKAA